MEGSNEEGGGVPRGGRPSCDVPETVGAYAPRKEGHVRLIVGVSSLRRADILCKRCESDDVGIDLG